MGRATRSSDPIELPGNSQHGLTGYELGCGCLTCRRGKADAQQRFKDRRDGRRPPAAVPPGAGKQEILTRTEIANLGDLTDEQESLANLAVINAKLVDTIEKEQRWHLLNATVRSLRDTMKELRGTMPRRKAKDAEEGDDDDFASNLRGFGEP